MVDGARRFGALVAWAVVVAIGLAACTGTAPAVLSVAIDGGDVVTDEGGTRALAWTVAVQGGAATTVTWETGDPSVATINAAGVLRGESAGSTTVTATSTVDPTKQATVGVRVQASGTGEPIWTFQFGLAGGEFTYGVAIDGLGRVAFVGNTTSTISTNPNDLRDSFAIVSSAAGAPIWDLLIATPAVDDAFGVVATGDGRVVVVGETRGSLEGPGANQGASDAYLRVYEPNGTLAWTRQFGSPNGDSARAVAIAPDGRLVVVGDSNGVFDGTPSTAGSDVYVRWYEPNGDLARSLKFGSAPGTLVEEDGSDGGYAVAVGADGRVAVGGRVRGTLAAPHAGNFDGFVRVFESDGSVMWTSQFGTSSDDEVRSVSVGRDGRIAVAGYTRRALDGAHTGGADAFVRVYERDGTLAWARQFGTTSDDEARGVAIDAAGNVVVAGFTEGSLVGVGAGGRDAFVRKYDPTGAERWTQQFGTFAADAINALAVDEPTGEIVVGGATSGPLQGANGGGSDLFVRRLGP
jgi:hypothetical protein